MSKIGSGRGSLAKRSSRVEWKAGPVQSLINLARGRCLEVLVEFFGVFFARLVGDPLFGGVTVFFVLFGECFLRG